METNENQNANTQNNAQSNDWQTVKTGEVVGKPEAEKNYNGIITNIDSNRIVFENKSRNKKYLSNCLYALLYFFL